jgi:hypothetical protein
MDVHKDYVGSLLVRCSDRILTRGGNAQHFIVLSCQATSKIHRYETLIFDNQHARFARHLALLRLK